MYEITNLFEEHIAKNDLIGSLELAINMNEISYYYGILHNQFSDLELEKDTEHKPHFHLYVDVPLDKSIKTLKKFVSAHIYNGCNVQAVRSPKATIRYLTHKNNPEKFQYNDNDVFTNNWPMYYDLITISNPAKKTKNNVITNEMLLNTLINNLSVMKAQNVEIYESDLIDVCKQLGKINYYITNSHRIIDFLTSYLSIYINRCNRPDNVEAVPRVPYEDLQAQKNQFENKCDELTQDNELLVKERDKLKATLQAKQNKINQLEKEKY